MPATVAIVGRPNVGKSTLFNRLTRSRKALTHDLPGVTRDRVAGEAYRPDGRQVVVVDTGGFQSDSEALIPRLVREQVLVAVSSADVVVLVVDAAAGVTAADSEIATLLRRHGRPVVVAANKADRRGAELGAGEFAIWGFPVVSVSAEHGLGIEALWELVEGHLPPAGEGAAPSEAELAVAIVGRPNVGKSSLLNRLVGGERVIVSPLPGTTRDAVDEVVAWGERRVRLVDTAGIRRRGRTDRGPEVLSVVIARRAIARAQVCVVVVDAAEGITAQDAHVAGLVLDAGRAAVVAVNKADLLGGRDPRREREMAQEVAEALKFLKGTPVVFTSAVSGRGVEHLLRAVLATGERFGVRIPTGELNRVLRAAWQRRPPPGGRKPPRLYYATQTASSPPRFTLFVSGTGQLHFSYLRYLENAVREAFPLEGVPVRFIMRGKGA
ncbi:MAG: ribosome biogenesis GTPase Der [Thermoanaerobaculaceae bacterium]|jgi:GTP-binding protein|nr:ribosome biogenesis GTPase Der [Thermoanaerobaculaceae bacterium]